LVATTLSHNSQFQLINQSIIITPEGSTEHYINTGYIQNFKHLLLYSSYNN